MVVLYEGEVLTSYPDTVSSTPVSSLPVSHSTKLLYLASGEYAMVYDYDTSIDIIGSDTSHNNTVLVILRSTYSTLVCNASHISTSDMDMMISTMDTNTMVQMTMVAGYQCQAMVMSILSNIMSSKYLVELGSLYLGPVVSGVGVHIKTGDIIATVFSDKGPDMDLRTARTLAGGQDAALLNIYNSTMEELMIGPFTYSPMRSVDIWLQMTDEFLLSNLSHNGEDVSILRSALSLIKNHPYPCVTIFRHNRGRCYRRDHYSGGWQPSSYHNQHQGTSCSVQYSQARIIQPAQGQIIQY